MLAIVARLVLLACTCVCQLVLALGVWQGTSQPMDSTLDATFSLVIASKAIALQAKGRFHCLLIYLEPQLLTHASGRSFFVEPDSA